MNWVIVPSLWFAGAMAGWGIRSVMHYAIPERVPDPRFGTILVLGGVGLLVVAFVSVFTS